MGHAMPIFLIAAFAFWGTVLGGGFYFIRRYLKVLEARNTDAAQLTEMRARIDALEEAAEATQRDIERLGTGQEFTTRLLGARAAPVERPT